MTDEHAALRPRVQSVPRARNVTVDSSYGRWIDRIARFGYLSKGIVYVVIGGLAFQVAIGAGGENTGSRGAVTEIARHPFGEVALWVVGVGLFAYALWRFVQAALDPDKDGSGVQHALKRGAYFVSGLVHVSLAAFAIEVALGFEGGGGNDSTKELTAQLMAQPFGHWLVGVAGVVVVVSGVVQFAGAKTAKFMDKIKPEISGDQRRWAKRAGRMGLVARGVVFVLVGWFLIQAAVQVDPAEAQGLGGALDQLARQSYGAWLLGVVASGLFFYGIFMLILARFRRIAV